MNKRPHLLYVCADRGVPIGGRKGASAHVTEMTKALGSAGAEVRILGVRTADAVVSDGFHAPVIDLSRDRAARLVRAALLNDNMRPRDHARTGELRGLMWNQAISKTIEKLHKNWKIDAVFERYSLWSYAAAVFARAHHLPFLLEVNSPLRKEQARYRTLDNAAAAADLESFLFASADRLMVPSSDLVPYVTRHGANPTSVVVLPNAADPQVFRGAQVTRRTDDQFVVGFLGTLKPWHGLDNLAKAFRLLNRSDPTYKLLLVGDGPMRAALRQYFREQGLLDSVTITGDVPHERVPELLAKMDAATVPYSASRDFYFSPLKMFEYMAAGVPIVASNLGQIRDVLSHRQTALLVKPGAVRELADAVREMRASPKLSGKLKSNARSLLRRRYTWKRNATKVLRMIAAARASAAPDRPK